MNHWMEITYDWCISRQLWWGHRIPAWYRGEEVYVGENKPVGDGWVQDEDVLDTWFSSALWPFSTLGWPEQTEDMKRYFPNDCLVTGYDIIPFWVNRMTFQSLELNGVRPFKDVVIHGLVRDKEGRKMSKSLGNGVDPFDMIDKYGTDALRYYLNTDCSFGTDLSFDEVKLSSTWNYINKIWNASRFVLMNIETLKEVKLENLSSEDKWILTKLEKLILSSNNHMDKYEFNLFALESENFIWNDFCSNYIEFAKFNLDKESTKSVLYYVLSNILKMLHPFMPFVTEEIYQMLPIKDKESIMISSYPEYNSDLVFENDTKLVEDKIEFIKAFRNVKAENGISKDAKVLINTNDDIIIKMLKLENLVNEKLNINSYNVKVNNIEATIYFEKVVTLEELKIKEKQIESLKNSISRREKLLSNENYLAKAPSSLVEKEKENLLKEKEELKLLEK
jgi:valyl-tRNA synthetase